MANYYNQQRKEEFITLMLNNADYEEAKHFYPRTFGYSEVFETKYDKDLCNFNREEIMVLFKAQNAYSIKTLNTLKSVYSRYVRWCNEQGLVVDGQNHFNEITSDDIIACTNTYAIRQGIITRADLLKQIRQLPNPIDSFILLAFFEGIEGGNSNEIVKVKLSDFKGDEVHLCTGRVIKVSKELRNWAEEANEQKSYTLMNTSPDAINTSHSLPDSPYIVRFKASSGKDFDEKRVRARLYRKCVKCFDYLGLPYCSISSLRTSGTIHMINEGANKAHLSAEEYISREREKAIRKQYNFRIPSISGFIKQYNQFIDPNLL